MKSVIHLHSCYSYDCLTSPKKIVQRAIKAGIDVLCITDHDTIIGAKIAKEYAEKHHKGQIEVIIGAEFSSDWGDIIGYDIQEDIKEKDALLIIQKIRELGGLVLLPHPYDSHKNVHILAEKADWVEIFNARSTPENNEKAIILAQKYQKTTYVASDAHFLSDTMLCINDTTANSPTVAYSPKSHFYCSQLIKSWKKKNPRLFISMIYYLCRSMIK